MTFADAWSALFGTHWRDFGPRAPEPHTDFDDPDKPLPVDLPDEHETL